MTVALPTTPANYFHLLRWQALSRGGHKPLVVFTPKSMLRLKAASSAVADFTSGSFLPVIGEPQALDPAGSAGCCCAPARSTTTWPSQRAEGGRTDTAIIRVERLYPIPAEETDGGTGPVPGRGGDHWVQEEPGEHGRLADHGAAAARAARPPGRRDLAAGQLGARRRLGQGAQGRAPSSW